MADKALATGVEASAQGPGQPALAPTPAGLGGPWAAAGPTPADPPPQYEAPGHGYPEGGAAAVTPTGELAPPPAYDCVVKLPSYDQSERTKDKLPVGATSDDDACEDGPGSGSGLGFTLLSLPTSPADSSDLDSSDLGAGSGSNLLGNDFVFFTAFITAFLFNWVGFMLLMCFCHTIASRYGALSGFGLSLTKWTLIVKKSTEWNHSANSWLWWLIMAFGLLICVRAIAQYLHIKRIWRNLTVPARERLFFFY